MLVKDYGVKEIGIQDDTFNIDINRSKRLAELLIKAGFDVPWSCPNGIRADLVDEELTAALRAEARNGG